MSTYELLLFIHLLLFVYWLGGDLGVFYSSSFVVNPSLSREARLTAAKIMLGCDLVPRICMALMLSVGGLLAHYIGVEHNGWQLVAIILLAPFWLAIVLVLHYRHNAPYIAALTKFDFYFRWFMVVAIIASSFYAYTTGRLAETPWLIAKLLAFAFLIFCGLMIRIKLSDFSTTYVKLLQNTHRDEDNQAMIKSLSKVRPWVVTIWFVLLLQAYLGIVKPF